jgi:hypothetical protein
MLCAALKCSAYRANSGLSVHKMMVFGSINEHETKRETLITIKRRMMIY